jgi:hypothetical protein
VTGVELTQKPDNPPKSRSRRACCLDLAIHIAELAPSLPIPLAHDDAKEPVTFDNWDPAVSVAQSTEVLNSRDVSGQGD